MFFPIFSTKMKNRLNKMLNTIFQGWANFSSKRLKPALKPQCPSMVSLISNILLIIFITHLGSLMVSWISNHLHIFITRRILEP